MTDAARAMWERDAASRFLGMTLEEVRPGAARLALEVAAHHCNAHGLCHGGIVFALADSACGYACNARAPAVTMHGLVSFLAPARLGDALIASARETHHEGRNGIYDVEVAGPAGPIAQFRGMSRALPGAS